MNIFSELKLFFLARGAMKNILKTLLRNGWKHVWTSAAGLAIAILLHYTGAHTSGQAVLQILTFALGWIAKNPLS